MINISLKKKPFGFDEKTESLKKEIKQKIEPYKNFPKIIVVGPIGSGKSSLCQVLSNKKVKIIEGNGKAPLLNGTTIGYGAKSKTQTPNIHVDIDNEIIIYDCPGFLDTGGYKQETIDSFSTEYLLSSTITDNKFKILFVFSMNNDRNQNFIKSFKQLKKIFPNIKKLRKIIGIVITQGDEFYEGIDLLNQLDSKHMENELIEFINYFKIHEDHVYSFPKAKHENINHYYDFKDHDKLLYFMLNDYKNVVLDHHTRTHIESESEFGSEIDESTDYSDEIKNFTESKRTTQKKVHSLEKHLYSPQSKQISSPIMPKIRFIDKIKDFCTVLKTEEGCPQIYKLPIFITNIYPEQKLRKIRVGPQSNTIKNEVKILIVGQTGSGKTTFLNGISNYLYGVEWDDDCRFKIVSDEDEGQQSKGNNQAISQTDYVTAYTFPWQPDFPVPYTVTLIDTPGFGDTRGIQRDKQLVDQLESFFKNSNDCGVDSLNTVAFIVQSALPRLNTAQQYIFNSIMKLFGKDIANNFMIVATFADAGDPQVLSAIKEANIPTNFVSKFNNSALFANRSGYNGQINHLFWEIGQTGYKSIFDNINKMEPISLLLTQSVLDERKKLYVSIEGLNRQIRVGLSKIDEIEKECKIIDQYKAEIQANKNFTTKVKVFKSNKIDLQPGQFVTNCSHCNKTCHFPCFIQKDCEKNKCSAMNSNGYCNVCGCYWDIHYNMPFRWEVYEVEEERTLNELKEKYGDAKTKKQTQKKMLKNAQNEYTKIWELISNIVGKCRSCVTRLHEIAFKPISLSEIDYIKLQIEGEKQNCMPGWDNRVKWLEELLEQEKLIGAISEGKESEIMPHKVVQIKNKRISDFLANNIGFKI